MAKREDMTGFTIKKECGGYIVDGIVIKTYMSKQEQLDANVKDKAPNSLVKCNLCGHIQNARNNHLKNNSYRCQHCKGYGHLFNTQIENTEWTVLRLATEEDIIKFGKENRAGVFLWCKCSCGKEQPVDIDMLKDLTSTKCKECASKSYIRQPTIGNKYGLLTVVELTDKKTNDGHYLVRCECDCGNKNYLTTLRELDNGRQCCGCLQRNPNLTDEERQIKRNYPECGRFRYNVKSKANYTCDCCGYIGHKHDGIMKAHHLNGWGWYDKDKRDDISNGVCLCNSCHNEFHNIYGYGDNTEAQYIKFKENKIELN